MREELTIDEKIARIAARQHGVIATEQLHRAGLARQSITRRIRAHHLHRLHRGVYALGHLGLGREGRWLAAVLACGEGAVLSHQSAGELWGMLRSDQPASSGRIRPSVPHVTVTGEARSRPGIKVHRSRTLGASQVTRNRGIPVTAASRTLADLRRCLPQPQFAQALRQAEYLRLRVDRSFEPDHTRSELEARFLAICRRHRLPTPAVNVDIGEFTVDFLWRDRRLVVELDGYRAHRGRSAFEADRTRDLEIRLLGYEVVRFTWRHLDDPRSIAVALRVLLTRPHPA